MIPGKQASFAEVDEQGRLILPPEIARAIRADPGREGARGQREQRRAPAPSHLAVDAPLRGADRSLQPRLRDVLSQQLGRVAGPHDGRDLCAHPRRHQRPRSRPTIFFGGIGEPTLHTHLPDWIEQAKALGCRVEMITNGTLLTEDAVAQVDRVAGWICCGSRSTARRPKVTPMCGWARNCRRCWTI